MTVSAISRVSASSFQPSAATQAVVAGNRAAALSLGATRIASVDAFERAPSSGRVGAQGGPLSTREQQRLAELRPIIQDAARRHGVDAGTLAAIVRTESNFENHRLHDDGHGHGLVGLDDRRGARGRHFEQQTGISLGRGRNSNIVSGRAQIDYLARTLSESTRRYGNENAAIREWHRGHSDRNDETGYAYQRRVEANRAQIGW